MKKFKLAVLTASVSIVLAGCGGGDSATVTVPAPKEAGPVAYVAGDSLVDVGVFGARFTVQSSNAAKPYLVWPELISNGFNLGTLCAAYSGSAFTPVANCTGFGVGGAQINPADLVRTTVAPGVDLVTDATIVSDSSAYSVIKQIADMGNGRTFGAKDLIMVDGGGNDIKVLAQSLLESLDPMNPLATQARLAYRKLLKDLLPAATVDAVGDAAGDVPALANLGGAYMQTTAVMLASAVKTNVIAKGGQRVLLLNAPNLTKVPAFSSVTDPTAQSVVNGWSVAYNAKLVSELAGETAKVLIVDFYTTLNGYVANPNTAVVGAVSLSNVTAKACGSTDITTCTDTALDASGPAGWRTHLFADGLHSTPFGNELLAQSVRSAITAKGWTY